jgi:FkbM family methyltransferase
MTYAELRRLVPPALKTVLRELSHATVFSDLGSLLRYHRVSHGRLNGPHASTVDLGIRSLGHRTITIRTTGTDARVLFSTFVHRFQLPPRATVSPDARLILDLGANIGCTMAHLAFRYPDATIVGVELDADNARLCRRNVAAWGSRCQVVEGAVWPDDGEVQYEHFDGRQDGYSARRSIPASSDDVRTVPAISLNSLVERYGDRVDYVKMDIEGAERAVLRRNTEWARGVGCIKVELHGPYSKDDGVADLRRLGFDARVDGKHALCVVGVRRGWPAA